MNFVLVEARLFSGKRETQSEKAWLLICMLSWPWLWGDAENAHKFRLALQQTSPSVAGRDTFYDELQSTDNLERWLISKGDFPL